MKRRTASPAPVRTLEYFAEERFVLATSQLWPQITAWQRCGWVSLRWGNSKDSCHVKLTDSGLAEVARLKTQGANQ